MRVTKHPILGDDKTALDAYIFIDGKKIPAKTGEPIAAALLAAGVRKFRETPRFGNSRGIFCGIGRCPMISVSFPPREELRLGLDNISVQEDTCQKGRSVIWMNYLFVVVKK